MLLALGACTSPGTLPSGPLPARSGEGPLLAGAGEADLTPIDYQGHPLPLAGYGSRHGKPLQGVHDQVHARALALAAGGVTVVIVSADILLFHEELSQKIRMLTSDLAIDGLLLAATHNHSGPGGFFDNWLAESVALGPFDEDYFEFLAARIAGAIRAACRDLRPARLGTVVGSGQGLNRNRRVSDGPTDPALTLIVVEREGETLATVVNFSAHATVLNGDNWLVSGDFPGALEMELVARGVRFPMFLNGSAGDLSARSPSGGSGFEKAAAIGRALADRSLALVPQVALHERALIATSRTIVPLPSKSTAGTVGAPLDWLLTPVAAPYLRDETEMQALRIGDAVLVSFPCDLNVLVGRQLKQCFPERTIVPVSYADDYIGYVVDPESYDARTYEASLSFYGREIGAFLASWGRALVEAVLR